MESSVSISPHETRGILGRTANDVDTGVRYSMLCHSSRVGAVGDCSPMRTMV